MTVGISWPRSSQLLITSPSGTVHASFLAAAPSSSSRRFLRRPRLERAATTGEKFKGKRVSRRREHRHITRRLWPLSVRFTGRVRNDASRGFAAIRRLPLSSPYFSLFLLLSLSFFSFSFFVLVSVKNTRYSSVGMIRLIGRMLWIWWSSCETNIRNIFLLLFL